MSFQHIVVVGANVAGLRAVESLRAEGFSGRVTLINGEETLPYSRPPLSKEVLTGNCSINEVLYRPVDYYRDLEVELISGKLATDLDLARKIITVGKESLGFDGLIIATGSSARNIPQCAQLEGVHVMRTLEDARQIRTELERKPRVVVVGAGFIGAEVAASACTLGLTVTIVEVLPVPLARVLGDKMGRACATLHGDNGTNLRCSTTLRGIEGSRRVERVRLADDTVIEADLVIVGIGVRPNVDWLARSGLNIEDGVLCDATLNVGHPDVFAAGDVAKWPNELFGKLMRCEHWTNACEQGRAAARNLLVSPRDRKPYQGSCYFWSDQYGSRIQFVGVPNGEAIIVSGSVKEKRFLALYRKEQLIVGALALNIPKQLMQCKLMIEKHTEWAKAVALLSSNASELQTFERVADPSRTIST